MSSSRFLTSLFSIFGTAAILLLTAVPAVPAQQGTTATPGAHPGRRVPGSGFSQPEPIDFNEHQGWTQIFDGKDLKGWDGSPDVWHYENGAIVGQSSDAHPSGTTNIIWRGGQVGNFELKLEIKLEGSGANGGVQYRSQNVPPTLRHPTPEMLAQITDEQKHRMEQGEELMQKHARWNMRGYQADADYNNRYTGQLYEQGTDRGIIAWRGQAVETVGGGEKPRLVATLGSSDELKAYIKPGQWNQMEIIADGNTLTHIINGHVMAVLVDTDPKYAASRGLIGLEIEGPGDVKISHRNIWLKQLP